MSSEPLFRRPTSVFIGGNNRPLLNWVAYAFAIDANPEFHWTDIRLRGELFDKTDLLGRNLIPADRLNWVYPQELARPQPAPTTDASGARPISAPDDPRRGAANLAVFLRLPPETQKILTSLAPGRRPFPLILSNAQRIVALYPAESVTPILRVIIASGALAFITFADAPPDGRRAFESVLHVKGESPTTWKQATLRVELCPRDGPFKAGSELRFQDIPPIADVLGREF